MIMKRFWMVIRCERESLNQKITIRHTTKAKAEAEAKRLCKVERDTFVVLESISAAYYPSPKIKIKNIKEENL